MAIDTIKYIHRKERENYKQGIWDQSIQYEIVPSFGYHISSINSMALVAYCGVDDTDAAVLADMAASCLQEGKAAGHSAA